MPFTPIAPEKLSHSIQRQIEALILQGILRPGDRLPAERDLAERLGVSRPSLREALADLQTAGLVTTRAGAGVFVADVLGSAFSPALTRLISAHPDAARDYLAFRTDLEGLAAERAARQATDSDLAVIAAVLTRMEAAHEAHDHELESTLDVEFHMAIVEASHNIIALHMMRSMYDLLREGVFYNRARMFGAANMRGALLDQHRAINAALQARDGGTAREAVAIHLDFVGDCLDLHLKADAHEDLAAARLRHLAQ